MRRILPSPTAAHACVHNTHVQELALQTRSRLAPFRRAQFWLPGPLTKLLAEHDAIVHAIIAGDGAAAGTRRGRMWRSSATRARCSPGEGGRASWRRRGRCRRS